MRRSMPRKAVTATAGPRRAAGTESTGSLAARIEQLGPWFHDLELDGIRTAPDHALGNALRDLWAVVRPAFPDDLTGTTVLDIGCNAGFYALEMHRRGARVTGIDHNARYLAQARLAAEVQGADIEYLELEVYDVDRLARQFDYVLFLGVFYHLRHPLYALEKVAALVRERLVFQSLLRGSAAAPRVADDYPISEEAAFREPGFPAMYFIEHSYAGDPTNWWIPNRAGMEAMLRAAGLVIDAWVPPEVFYCSSAR
jgi:tRNA (mo5U34)-methyltransferase